MLAHSGVQNLSPFLELLLVDFAAREAFWRMSRGVFTSGTPDPTWLGPVSHPGGAQVITYDSEPMIFRNDASENALSVVVRTLPPAPSDSVYFATASSSGASTTTTPS